jgi:hypothetical protein
MVNLLLAALFRRAGLTRPHSLQRAAQKTGRWARSKRESGILKKIVLQKAGATDSPIQNDFARGAGVVRFHAHR